MKIANVNYELHGFLPIRWRVNRHPEVDQSHATDDKGELEETDATANSAILFRYHTTLLFSTHRVILLDFQFIPIILCVCVPVL